MTTVQRENIVDALPELQPLLQLHWREIAHYQDILLNPDYDFYRNSPVLRCFTTRDDGRLTGYVIFGVSRNRHYMDSVQAVQDILFVHPADRGGVGRRLIRASEAELKAEGVQVVYHHQKIAHPALGELLRTEGYEPIEVVWAKRLDKE
jgi:GNAT superfamily N-acetyltransferase